MPTVTMPDGAVVEMPDTLTPEQGQRLRALQSAPTTPKEPSYIDEVKGNISRFGLSGPAGMALGLGLPGIKALDRASYDAGGRLTDILSRIGAPPSLAAAGGLAGNVALGALPGLAGGAIGKLAAPAVEAAGTRLMRMAVNPSIKDMRTGRADTAVQTLFDKGLDPTVSGMDALRSQSSDISKQISTLLSARAGAPSMPKRDVDSAVNAVVANIEKYNPTPNGSRQAAESVFNEFKANNLVPKDIPLTQAQDLKQGIYRIIQESYNKPQYGPLDAAGTASLKAMAGELKRGIATAAPEVIPLNEAQGKIIDTMKVIEAAALKGSKASPVGMGFIAHNPGLAAAYIAERNPVVRSMLARALYQGSEAIPETIGAGLGTGLGVLHQQRNGILSQ